jgi:hypothetical protein
MHILLALEYVQRPLALAIGTYPAMRTKAASGATVKNLSTNRTVQLTRTWLTPVGRRPRCDVAAAPSTVVDADERHR